MTSMEHHADIPASLTLAGTSREPRMLHNWKTKMLVGFSKHYFKQRFSPFYSFNENAKKNCAEALNLDDVTTTEDNIRLTKQAYR